jgi:hypothetical protein
MPFNVAVILAFGILITSLMVMVAIASRRKQAAKEDEMRRAASARGWKFEGTRKRGYQIHRWTGTTEGVPWVAESLVVTPSGNHRQKRPHVARWTAEWNPGFRGAILAMGLPKDKEQLGPAVAAGDGFFAKLAQKAAGFAFDKAIDAYFGEGPGKEVDAGAMHRIETKIPGFIIMAADKNEGSRLLSQGLETALIDATKDRTSALSNENRPWILLRPKAVSLARMDRFHSIDDVDGFVRAGVALTRTSKFGRPFV